MPTGYTECVLKGASFEEFVWCCARAMGACIMQRDDSLNAPIDMSENEYESNYYKNRLEEAEKDYTEWVNSSNEDKVKLVKDKQEKSKNSLYQSYQRTIKENKKFDEMAEKVRNWLPPSANHINFKKFMIDQLQLSKSDTDWYEEEIQRIDKKSVESLIKQYEDGLLRDIAYYQKELKEERDRNQERYQWKKTLANSVPIPDSVGIK